MIDSKLIGFYSMDNECPELSAIWKHICQNWISNNTLESPNENVYIQQFGSLSNGKWHSIRSRCESEKLDIHLVNTTHAYMYASCFPNRLSGPVPFLSEGHNSSSTPAGVIVSILQPSPEHFELNLNLHHIILILVLLRFRNRNADIGYVKRAVKRVADD